MVWRSEHRTWMKAGVPSTYLICICVGTLYHAIFRVVAIATPMKTFFLCGFAIFASYLQCYQWLQCTLSQHNRLSLRAGTPVPTCIILTRHTNTKNVHVQVCYLCSCRAMDACAYIRVGLVANRRVGGVLVAAPAL